MVNNNNSGTPDYPQDTTIDGKSMPPGMQHSDKTHEPAPKRNDLLALSDNNPFIDINDLHAGYGNMTILHGLSLAVGKGQALCLIGPNGAGKSTVLHSLYGFTQIHSGSIIKNQTDITHLSPTGKLKQARIAYILQDNSVFPQMTVEENLVMGGFVLNNQKQAKQAADSILQQYPRLAARRQQAAGNLSGGERRLLEISRALIMDPDVLLVDEPSIGLEPRYIQMVFDIFTELKTSQNKTIIMVEQNAKKGLEFADIGYVLVSGQVALAGQASKLLDNPVVGRLFLGG